MVEEVLRKYVQPSEPDSPVVKPDIPKEATENNKEEGGCGC